MFVRFRQTKARVQASLIQTRRVGGRVRHEHVAMLGTVDAPPSVAGRLAFWQRLHERMERLGNRVDAAAQAKLLGDIHTRIQMVTIAEQRALQLANAKADAQFWDGFAEMHAGTIEGQAGLIAGAERAKAGAAAEHARAAEEAARAKDRVARIERGEDVAGGLGKPLTWEDVRKAGWTRADVARCVQAMNRGSKMRTSDVASSLARQKGIKPPPGYKTSISIGRKFLSEHAPKKADGETAGKLRRRGG